MTGRRSAGSHLGAVLAIGLLAGGCQMFKKKEAAPLQPPLAQTTLTQYAGTALSGAQARGVSDDALAKLWLINVRIITVEQLPTEGFERLTTQARLIITTRGGTPIAPSVRMTPGLRFRSVPGDFELDSLMGDPKRFAEIHKATGAVAAGTTMDLRVAVDTTDLDITSPLRQAILLKVSRGEAPDAYDLAVSGEDLLPPPSYIVPNDLPLGALPPRPPMAQLEQETLVAPRQFQAEQDRVLLAIPMTFANSTATGVVIDLSIQAAPTEADRDQAVEPLKQQLLASSAAASKRVAVTTGSAEELAMGSALSALVQTGDDPRGALAYLADQTGAGLTENVVLVADTTLLQLIAKSITEAAPGLQKRDKANVAWLLDRTTVSSIAALAGNATNPITPPVMGALITYAGEVGRQLDALNSLVGQSNGPQDLQNRLTAEHRLYLEDSSPAARVRAFDWLKERSLAPAGYDPLSPARQRRAALEQPNPSASTLPSSTQPATQPSNEP